MVKAGIRINKHTKVKLKTKKAVVLLSGGLDSAVTLYAAKRKGYKVYSLTFDYGQRHKKEIIAAKKIARLTKSAWRLLKFTMPRKGSSLIDRKLSIPKNRAFDKKIPTTYVPSRNIIFLSLAASYAESLGAEAIFIGANEIDFSGYPDCRLKFLKSFERTLKLGTKTAVLGKKITICAPLVKKNKAQIIKLAAKLGAPLEHTWSCYQGKGAPCCVCDSCRLRQQGFKMAKMEDPAL